MGSSNRSGSLTAAILAGGKSRRMKRDKALLQDGQGQTWLSRTIHLAKSRADRVLVLTGSESRYQEICEKEGVDSYPDDTKDCGPLGGIQKALRLTQASYLLCLTCDMPGLTTDHLKELGSPNPSEDIVFSDGTFFPLVIRVSPQLMQQLNHQVHSSQRSVASFLSNAQARSVSFESLPARNLNFPEETNSRIEMQK